EDAESAGSNGPDMLGTDPATGEEITLRTGRFGPYVQRGDGKEAKRASLPKGWKPEDITEEKALALLALPREIGIHPESGKPISAGIGRYGPFVLHDGTYANLENVEEVFTIGINRAVAVLAEKKSRGAGSRAAASTLPDFGEHPELGGRRTVNNGRYGPYLHHGKINATLPMAMEPEGVSLETGL